MKSGIREPFDIVIDLLSNYYFICSTWESFELAVVDIHLLFALRVQCSMLNQMICIRLCWTR